MSTSPLEASTVLPSDRCAGTLVGRAWDPAVGGPTPVVIHDDGVFDLSEVAPTVAALASYDDPVAAVRGGGGRRLGGLGDLLGNTGAGRQDPARPWLLSPVDLQTLKAAGVTFAVSMIERVIEERVRGDARAATVMREAILAQIGGDLREIRPGSSEAGVLREFLVEQGLWSQYLEVGIGPDAEIFTKGPTLSSVGPGAQVGVLSTSQWNNPEPEVALVVDPRARVVGATLANDVNLRDLEGRSALLLSKAKDNNASCAIGPFVRLFDETFDLDAVRAMSVRLRIDGDDGFGLDDSSDMSQISRDPLDLVDQLMGPHHQYPDGAVLMLGTMFAPIVDRDEIGGGFTHRRGDIVTISSDALGSLVNEVEWSERCEPWTWGISATMANLATRGLL